MAEAEGQRKASTSNDSPIPSRTRVVGFDASTASHPMRPIPKSDHMQKAIPTKVGSGSPWLTPKVGQPSGRQAGPAVGGLSIARNPTGTRSIAPASGLSRDLRENLASETRVGGIPDAALSVPRQGEKTLDKGKTPLGPTFIPSRQPYLPAGAVPITRRVS